MMNDFFKPDWFGGMQTINTYVPAVNIKESETNFQLELSVPGFKKDDFNIEVDDTILTISSELKTDNQTKEDNYTRREFSSVAFKRAFTLPETINESKINAQYEAGILKLTFPKKEEALPKPKRLIEIG